MSASVFLLSMVVLFYPSLSFDLPDKDAYQNYLDYIISDEFLNTVKDVDDRTSKAPEFAVKCFNAAATDVSQEERKAVTEQIHKEFDDAYSEGYWERWNKVMHLRRLIEMIQRTFNNEDFGKELIENHKKLEIPIKKGLDCYKAELNDISKEAQRVVDIALKKYNGIED